jgi:hypothetical protein
MAVAAPLAAQQPASAIHRGGDLPAGWNIVFDNPEHTLEGVMFMQMGTGFHAKIGMPRAIVWNDANETGDNYQVTATFTQPQAPERLEGYGLIFGGEDLGESEVEYFYFLIRHDGQFIIKARNGAETPTIQDWTAHEAIKQADDTGKVVNTVTVDVGETVRFLVNGTEVANLPRATFDEGDLDGIAGFRINHGLEVMIDGFQVTEAN